MMFVGWKSFLEHALVIVGVKPSTVATSRETKTDSKCQNLKKENKYV